MSWSTPEAVRSAAHHTSSTAHVPTMVADDVAVYLVYLTDTMSVHVRTMALDSLRWADSVTLLKEGEALTVGGRPGAMIVGDSLWLTWKSSSSPHVFMGQVATSELRPPVGDAEQDPTLKDVHHLKDAQTKSGASSASAGGVHVTLLHTGIWDLHEATGVRYSPHDKKWTADLNKTPMSTDRPVGMLTTQSGQIQAAYRVTKVTDPRQSYDGTVHLASYATDAGKWTDRKIKLRGFTLKGIFLPEFDTLISKIGPAIGEHDGRLIVAGTLDRKLLLDGVGVIPTTIPLFNGDAIHWYQLTDGSWSHLGTLPSDDSGAVARTVVGAVMCSVKDKVFLVYPSLPHRYDDGTYQMYWTVLSG